MSDPVPPSPPPPPPAADELAAASHTNEANAETMRARGKDGEALFFLALAGFQAVAAGALCADIRTSRPLLLRGGALLVRQGFSSIVVPLVALLRHAKPDPVWEAEVTEAARASKFDASEAQLIMAGEIMHRAVRRYCARAHLGAHAHAEIVAKGDVDPGPSSNGLHNAQSMAGAAAAAATLLSFPTLRGVHATIAAYFFDQIDKPARRDAFVGMAQLCPPETSLFADPDGTVGPDVFAFCEKHGIKLPPLPPAAPASLPMATLHTCRLRIGDQTFSVGDVAITTLPRAPAAPPLVLEREVRMARGTIVSCTPLVHWEWDGGERVYLVYDDILTRDPTAETDR